MRFKLIEACGNNSLLMIKTLRAQYTVRALYYYYYIVQENNEIHLGL